MKEQIHNLRIRIDGLSQLVKELKSFEWNIYEVDVPKEMNGFTSFLYRVMTSLSISPNDNAKFHGIIHTDKGTFRCASWIKEEIQLFNIDFKSKEINKCYDSLILAKAWLGKILRALGEETPYKNDGKRKTIEDIEETNDTHKRIGKGVDKFISETSKFSELNYIEKVDWLRCSIEDVVKEIISLELKENRELAVARTNSYSHLCESKTWLGFELGRIRDSK